MDNFFHLFDEMLGGVKNPANTHTHTHTHFPVVSPPSTVSKGQRKAFFPNFHTFIFADGGENSRPLSRDARTDPSATLSLVKGHLLF
ncbi:MAG: hypothetical protein LBU62_11745 [Bacteroidales bacterium]|nr:hypothetical protein [Bacteroidales bacterium]